MGLFRSSEVVGVAGSALDFALAASEEAHPREYMGMLRGEAAGSVGVDADGTILTEVLVIPGTESNPTSASFKPTQVPNDLSAAGSIHSHPNGVLRPSDADLATFERNEVHIIVGAPYGPDDWQAFDNDGRPIDLPVYEIDPPEESFFDFTQEDLDARDEDER
jgi:proteasome lid subunit RPN8/RPN11